MPAGPPAVSLDALEEYFLVQGREWERFAWFKGRVIARTGLGFTESLYERERFEEVLKVAADNPNVKFEHATGYKQAPNMRTYDSRTYEGAYMAGIIAGHDAALTAPYACATPRAAAQSSRPAILAAPAGAVESRYTPRASTGLSSAAP